ncbi:unnamed protein product [Lasius platythorax]|uniref:Uncharacterized protein n=1 Tax=Lasius platythorax TaxID=488582 RepID=A0AAV2P7E7_9HYME
MRTRELRHLKLGIYKRKAVTSFICRKHRSLGIYKRDKARSKKGLRKASRLRDYARSYAASSSNQYAERLDLCAAIPSLQVPAPKERYRSRTIEKKFWRNEEERIFGK